MPHEGVGKALHNHPTNVEVKRGNHCYFKGIVYLLAGSQDQHFVFRQSLCDHVADEHDLMSLQSYMPPEYKTGSNYNDKRKSTGCTLDNEVMIVATAKITGRHNVMYVNGQWEWHCVIGTFKKHTEMQYIFIPLKIAILIPLFYLNFII